MEADLAPTCPGQCGQYSDRSLWKRIAHLDHMQAFPPRLDHWSWREHVDEVFHRVQDPEVDRAPGGLGLALFLPDHTKRLWMRRMRHCRRLAWPARAPKPLLLPMPSSGPGGSRLGKEQWQHRVAIRSRRIVPIRVCEPHEMAGVLGGIHLWPSSAPRGTVGFLEGLLGPQHL